jgi:hypothetical protein
MTTHKSPLADRWLVVAGLRRWAQGVPADEAAVELLVSMSGRFTLSRCQWVRPCRRPGWFWLDPDELCQYPGRLSESERRVLALVVTLLGGQPSRTLAEGVTTTCPIPVRRAAA